MTCARNMWRMISSSSSFYTSVTNQISTFREHPFESVFTNTTHFIYMDLL
jgi:hypothetical protein